MSELITISSSIKEEVGGGLLPELIFFTSWPEQMKILLAIVQNSLQEKHTNQHGIDINRNMVT